MILLKAYDKSKLRLKDRNGLKFHAKDVTPHVGETGRTFGNKQKHVNAVVKHFQNQIYQSQQEGIRMTILTSALSGPCSSEQTHYGWEDSSVLVHNMVQGVKKLKGGGYIIEQDNDIFKLTTYMKD